MEISVSDAKATLTDLVRRAEAGDEVVLTRHGQAVARLESVHRRLGPADRLAFINAVQASARDTSSEPPAARSQDFLYKDDGLPG